MSKTIKFKDNTYLYGTIIEEGTETDGKWIKYSNGILIYHGSKKFENLNFDNQYGSIFIPSEVQFINFPAIFSEINDIKLSIQNFSGGVGGISGGGYTSNSIRFYIWHAIKYTLSVTVSFEIYGKWK